MGRQRSWTDDDLGAAVDGARSWEEVRRRLGLQGGGSTNAALRARAAEIGLDITHLPAPGTRPRRWTDDDLAKAVAAARSLHDVFRQLGLVVGGSSWQQIQAHILRLGLDTSHWTHGLLRPGERRPAPQSFGDNDLRQALAGARSFAEVLRHLGLDSTNGAAYRRVKRRIRELGLSTDHLSGQAWSRGSSLGRKPRLSLDELLVRGSTYRNGKFLKRRLVEAGVLEPRCAVCGLTEWRDQPAPLHLDHVNGDPTDNRRENLRLLCPNCHAQTDTYAGRNIGGGYSSATG